ncbi:hypothetical protein [Vibrio parahaemolyticus]|uniref:hypothetical protein n=1 Tax=Vibrio parahaemolyticus TaxID=670 RepID=UPI000AFC5AC6|nr:hypothetical protein [Vibrio parahaemolyticus]
MEKIYEEDLRHEASLWGLNKYNKYKTTGSPDEAHKIYYGFIEYLYGRNVGKISVKHEDYIEFLDNMYNDYRAIEFSTNYLVIIDN